MIEAAIQQSISDESLLHVESTSSQVNQFGGYTRMAPSQFADWVYSAAKTAGLPANRILLGGDHLGPFPWRKEACASAMEKASGLVRDCVPPATKKSIWTRAWHAPTIHRLRSRSRPSPGEPLSCVR